MKTVPNQKVVTIGDKVKCDRTHLYTITNLEVLKAASQNLEGAAFKLWIYLAKNQAGYEFALSSSDAMEWGIGCKKTYLKAVNELIEKGYLVETSKNHYSFYEMVEEETIFITKVSNEEDVAEKMDKLRGKEETVEYHTLPTDIVKKGTSGYEF